MRTKLDIFYIKKILDGDKDAFRYFIKEYQEMAFSIVISIVKNAANAEDIVQNGFVQAYISLRSFRKESKFSSWLYKIMINEALKHVNKNKKRFIYNNPDYENTTELSIDNSIIKEISIAERKEKIKSTLVLMKPKEALVLKLHYLNEFSIKEIMVITGFSKSNVKILLHRARKNFIIYYSKDKY
ncbi:MAG: RNA polymerase sigma factor [Saprospiraceae bacterium]